MKPPTDVLRHFRDLDDLFDTCQDETILRWVNEYVALKEKQKTYGQRHRLRRRLMEETLKKVLDKDEIERIHEIVEEKLEGGGE